MTVKSDRLKKLESELRDLEEWKRLGLVPKKDQKKHEEEILAVRERIEEEQARLEFLKENGEDEEYIPPKKGVPRQSGYINMPTLPDVDLDEGANNNTSSGYTDISSETTESTEFENTTTSDVTVSDATESDFEDEEDDDPFSDANRWRRGIADPDDEDNW